MIGFQNITQLDITIRKDKFFLKIHKTAPLSVEKNHETFQPPFKI